MDATQYAKHPAGSQARRWSRVRIHNNLLGTAVLASRLDSESRPAALLGMASLLWSSFRRKPESRILLYTRGVIGSLIASWFFGSTALAASPQVAPLPRILIFADGVLTARLQKVPLHQVMDEVSQQSGVRVRWLNGGSTELVSVDFQHLPITEALQRLLPQRNFLLLYHAERLQQIWVTSAGQGADEPIRASLTDSSSSAEEERTEDEEEPVALSPRELLAQGQELALHAKNEMRRADAIKWLASEGGDDLQSRTTLLQIANDPTDPFMQALAAELLEQRP